MLNIKALYTYQKINGDLSEPIKANDELEKHINEQLEELEKKMDGEFIDDLLDRLAIRHEFYEERAYVQGFKDAISILSETR